MDGQDLASIQIMRQEWMTQYPELLQPGEPLIVMDETQKHYALRLRGVAEEESANEWCAALALRNPGEQCAVKKTVRTEWSATWQVQVIATHALEDAKTYRHHLLAEYGDLLRDYPISISTTESGDYFRLRLTAIPTEAIAQTICTNLQASGIHCFVLRTKPPTQQSGSNLR